MRKLKLILASLFITASLFSQFEVCNSNTLKTLNDVYFIDENIGIAVGDSGIIIRSSDGGDNWTEILGIDSIDFTKVKFWDTLNGIAVGTKIYSTSNGGLDWKYQDILEGSYCSDLELFPNNEFIVSNYIGSHFTGDSSYIYKLQFLDEKINVLFERPLDYKIIQISFINDSIGYANHFNGSKTSSMLRTADGGETWSQLDFNSGGDITLIEDIGFISDEIGFKGGWYDAHLKKTIDGGLNWNTVNIENSNNTIFDIPQVLGFHIDLEKSSHFYSCGWHGEIFKSKDLGDNWNKLESPFGSGTSLRAIYFINDNLGWAVGDNGAIIKTINGGELTSTTNIDNHKVKIFPNPFEGFLKIDLPLTQFEKIKIYSLTGKLIKLSDDNFLEDLEILSPGIYILTIETINSIRSYKILKK